MGSYVDENLMPGEQVMYRAELHWIIYLPHILLMLIVIGFFTILGPFIRKKTTEMAITNRRVIIKTGWVSRQTLEMNLNKIETIGVDQTIFGRMLGYGTITVVGTGGTREQFMSVSDPLKFRRQFNELSAT